MLLRTPGIPPSLRARLAQDEAAFTKGDIIRMTIALAEALPKATMGEQTMVTVLMSRLVDHFESFLRAGLDVRQSQRDTRGGTTALTFVGADARAASGDENAAQFLDPVYSSRDGVFGFPQTQRVAGGQLWDFYRANPQSFTKNDTTIYNFPPIPYAGGARGSYELTFVAIDGETQWSEDPEFDTSN